MTVSATRQGSNKAPIDLSRTKHLCDHHLLSQSFHSLDGSSEVQSWHIQTETVCRIHALFIRHKKLSCVRRREGHLLNWSCPSMQNKWSLLFSCSFLLFTLPGSFPQNTPAAQVANLSCVFVCFLWWFILLRGTFSAG